jgi:hypothetical protein
MATNQVSSRHKSFPFFIKIIAFLLCFILAFEQSGFAQISGELDLSNRIGNFINSFPATFFRLPHLRYISYDKLNQSFKIILNKGDAGGELAESARQPLKFFYIGLAVPNENLWVNLRPDSEDRIIDDYLAKTDLGKILLEADLELKKDLARSIFPSTPEGKEYWDKIYKKIEEVYGDNNSNTQASINTRIWITPGDVVICEDQNSAYIYKAGLNVLTEAAYLSNNLQDKTENTPAGIINKYSAQLIQELILPKISKELNTGKKYASLRQVYYSLILAQWFKVKFYGAGGIYPYLINRNNLRGLTSDKSWSKDTYFKEYQKSYREKEYDLQVQVFNLFGRSIRTYSSGGVDFTGILNGVNSFKVIPSNSFSPPLTKQTVSLEVNNQKHTLQDPYFSEGSSIVPLPEQASLPDQPIIKEGQVEAAAIKDNQNRKLSLNNFVLKILFSRAVSKPLAYIGKAIASLPKPILRLMTMIPLVGVLLFSFSNTAYAFTMDADVAGGSVKDWTFTFQPWHGSPDRANETLSGMGQIIGQAHGLKGQALTDFIYNQFIPDMKPILASQGIPDVNVILDGQQIKVPAHFLDGLTPDGLKNAVNSLSNNGWSPMDLNVNTLPSTPVTSSTPSTPVTSSTPSTPVTSSTPSTPVTSSITQPQKNNDFFTEVTNLINNNKTIFIIAGVVLAAAIIFFVSRAIYHKVKKSKLNNSASNQKLFEQAEKDYLRAKKNIEEARMELEKLDPLISSCKADIEKLIVDKKKYPDDSAVKETERVLLGYLNNLLNEQKKRQALFTVASQELLIAENQLKKIKKNAVVSGDNPAAAGFEHKGIPDIEQAKTAGVLESQIQQDKLEELQSSQSSQAPPVINIRLQQRFDRAEEDYLRAKKDVEEIKAESEALDSRINKRKVDIQKLIAAKERYLADGRVAYAKTVERIIQSCLDNLLNKRNSRQERFVVVSEKLQIAQNRLEKIKKNIVAATRVNLAQNKVETSIDQSVADVTGDNIPVANSDYTKVLAQESRLLSDLAKLLGLRVSEGQNGQEIIQAILRALMDYDYEDLDFERARGIARHIHPKDFKELMSVGRSIEPFASNQRLQYVLDNIERPSELMVGLSRTDAKLHDWQAKLKKNNLAEQEISQILEYCQSIYELLPLRLTQETSDNISPVYKRMKTTHDLVRETISYLIEQKANDKLKYAESVKKLAKWGHYFSDYIGALGHLSALNIAKGYIVNIEKANGNNGNGNNHKIKYSLWHRISAVPFIALMAKRNLNKLMERLNTEGNNNRTPEEHYKYLNPTRIGPTSSWLIRKPVTLIVSFIWAFFNIASNISSGPIGLLGIIKSLVGFALIPIFHYGFAALGNYQTKKDLKKLHNCITQLEKKWDILPLNNQIAQQEPSLASAGQKAPANNKLNAEDYALAGGMVTKQDVEAIAELADALRIKPVIIPEINEELAKLFGPGKFIDPVVIVMPEAQMLTKDYQKINGPVRLGNTIFVGSEYLRNGDFKSILADIAHEQMAQWVAVKNQPGLNADAHSLAEDLAAVVTANKAVEQSAPVKPVPIVPPGNAPGGIDFRAINFTVKPIPMVVERNSGLNIADQLLDENVKQEITEINRLIKAKIIPSSQRFNECLKRIITSGEGGYFNQLNNSLAEIFMLEEEYSQPSETSFVNLLQTVVLNK